MDKREEAFISEERKGERGIAMVIVLLFLAIMTMIGITAMESSGLQNRMSGNMRDQDISFQATENALREGETWIAGLNVMPVVSASGSGNCAAPCATTVWDLDAAEINAGNFLSHTFWDAGVNLRTGNAVLGALTAPRFVIEYDRFISDPLSGLNIGQAGDENGRELFRITARGTGETNTSRNVIQSTYARRF